MTRKSFFTMAAAIAMTAVAQSAVAGTTEKETPSIMFQSIQQPSTPNFNIGAMGQSQSIGTKMVIRF